MNGSNSTLISINELESIISAGPNVNNKSPENKIDTPIQTKPFNKFLDINRIGSSKKDSINKTPSSITPNLSPLNHGLCQSPNSFMESIPESNLLADCVCFADVWSKDGDDNLSYFYARILKRMGATVVRSFTKKDPITHLIFKDGHNLYLKKAKKRNILIVTCTWIQRCRLTQIRVDENDFLFNDTNYKPPKKFKEKQPIDAEEQLLRSIEKERRLKNKKTPKKKTKFFSPLLCGNQKEGKTFALETPYHDPRPHRFVYPRSIPETPDDNIAKKIERMKAGKPIFTPPSSPSSSTCSLEDGEDDKSNYHVGNHVPIYDELSKQLTFSDTENNTETKENEPISDNTLLSTQKSQTSDMELTCMIASCRTIGMDNNNTKRPSLDSNSTLTSNSTRSSMNLHLSSDQSSHYSSFEKTNPSENHSNNESTRNESSVNHLSENNESSMQLRLDESLSNPSFNDSAKNSKVGDSAILSLNQFESFRHEIKVTSPKPMVEIKTLKKKRKIKTHRKLYDEEVLKPASILYTPTMEIQPLTPRRSSRRSSVAASVAITSAFVPDRKTPRKSFSFKDSSLLSTPVKSIVLPPVGETAVKLLTTTGRFFSSPTSRSVSSSPDHLNRSCCSSISTSYDETEISKPIKTQKKELSFVDELIAAGLSGKKANSRGSSLLKRDRPSSDSSSSTDKIIASKKCTKPHKKMQCLDHNGKAKNNNNRLLIPSTSVTLDNYTMDFIQFAISHSIPSTIEMLDNFTRDSIQFNLFTNVPSPIKPRRSTDEFVTTNYKNGNHCVRKKREKKLPVVVLTSFHKPERIAMEKMIRQLGHFRVHSRVKDELTSHVICGEGRRTVNVLLGISRGLWLLSKEWVTKSHEAGRWQPEESYEAFEFFPAARFNRLQRHCNASAAWKSKLFSPVDGNFYIAPNTTPAAEDIKELVTSNGGHVINSPGRAAVRVGHMFRSRDLKAVQETWVLDSISENELKSMESYVIPTKSL